MNTHYTDEKAIQVVISLLKQYGIRKVIASPGTTNLSFVASIQQDAWFEIYSSVDERSAAYIACGLAAESGEPVVLSCTGATASRNYMPGLTEAYYRKLPIIAITSTNNISNAGHLLPQFIDRDSVPNDICKYHTQIFSAYNDKQIWDCEMKVNTALLECRRNGGGPVHLNLENLYSKNYDVNELPTYRKIDRITLAGKFPTLSKGKIAIFIGAHAQMTEVETEAIDKFCASNNAVAFCDHTSSYRGKFAVHFSLFMSQESLSKTDFNPDLLIHIGEVSGDYYNLGVKAKEVWRVNPDGEIRDTFKKLTKVFEMPIEHFFSNYTNSTKGDDSYLNACQETLNGIRTKLPEIPFSNVWLASQLASQLPNNSTIHFGILNSLRAWNFFELPTTVKSMSNVGGFGIDGCTSSLIGASLCNQDNLYYLVTGDLAFFYDMNVIGNRHIGNNVRILLVNNGKGTEFRNYSHSAARFGDEADLYMAAGGHFGNKSSELVKNYAENLGYEYISASNKDEFNSVYSEFINPKITDKPMIFEVFTNNQDESDALKSIRNIESDISSGIKNTAKSILGDKGVKTLKNILGK